MAGQNGPTAQDGGARADGSGAPSRGLRGRDLESRPFPDVPVVVLSAGRGFPVTMATDTASTAAPTPRAARR